MTKITGLDKLQKKLEKSAKQLKKLEGNQNIPIQELLNQNFLKKYTDFNTLDEILDKFSITTNEDIDNNIEQLDNEVKTNSNFSTWQEMLEKAAVEYLETQLNNTFK